VPAVDARHRLARGARPLCAVPVVVVGIVPHHAAAFPWAIGLSIIGALALRLTFGFVHARRASAVGARRARTRARRDALARAVAEKDLARVRSVVDDALAERAGDDVRARDAVDLTATLAARGIPTALVDEVVALRAALEAVLYAPPAGADRRALFERALSVVRALDGEDA
jgi:hypothetical protein